MGMTVMRKLLAKALYNQIQIQSNLKGNMQKSPLNQSPMKWTLMMGNNRRVNLNKNRNLILILWRVDCLLQKVNLKVFLMFAKLFISSTL